nr:RNA-directed DNA polymerase, eukaryota, reverse transcriptase zinc-binding domain protein [Tanacetum cinerariifolium]
MVFFGNVSGHLQSAILEIMPFAIGSLPVKYLGVLLISSTLFNHRCSYLVDKDIPEPKDACWSWRKILQCRSILRNHLVHRVGLSLNCKVSDVVVNGEWIWPDHWRGKFPFLFNLPPPLLIKDWKDKRLVLGASVYYVWQERNMRLFQKKFRSAEDLCFLTRDTVRCKMLSLKARNSSQESEAASLWNFKDRDMVIDFRGPNATKRELDGNSFPLLEWLYGSDDKFDRPMKNSWTKSDEKD